MDRELANEVKRLADASDPLRNGALKAATDTSVAQGQRDAADTDMRELKKASQQLESNLMNHRAIAADVTRVVDLSGKAVSFAQSAGPLSPEAASALTAIQGVAQSLTVAFGR